LKIFSDDQELRALFARLFVIPGLCAQPTLNKNRITNLHVLSADLCELTPESYIHKGRVLFGISGVVSVLVINCDRDGAYGGSTWYVTQLWLANAVTKEMAELKFGMTCYLVMIQELKPQLI
jgi:hypothetical protein